VSYARHGERRHLCSSSAQREREEGEGEGEMDEASRADKDGAVQRVRFTGAHDAWRSPAVFRSAVWASGEHIATQEQNSEHI